MSNIKNYVTKLRWPITFKAYKILMVNICFPIFIYEHFSSISMFDVRKHSCILVTKKKYPENALQFFKYIFMTFLKFASKSIIKNVTVLDACLNLFHYVLCVAVLFFFFIPNNRKIILEKQKLGKKNLI